MSIRLVSEAAGAGPKVSGFAGNGFRIDDAAYPAGALLTPLSAVHWDAPALESLGIEDLEAVLALDPVPEFVVIGTGAAMVRPPRALVGALEARGIGVEPMDSRAAARAWGVLRAEDRWISAALLPLDR